MNDEIEVIVPAKVAKNDGPYPKETLGEEEDDGTMPNNVEALEEKVVGHRIVKCEKRKNTIDRDYGRTDEYFAITLDNGMEVQMYETYDCCASTYLQTFLLNPGLVDHIITGVGTTDGYDTWHIYCDWGDILKLEVAWSCGNPFYYGYGFDIKVVVNADEQLAIEAPTKAVEA